MRIQFADFVASGCDVSLPLILSVSGGQPTIASFRHPMSKVLYMSGYTDDTTVRHGIEEGAVSLLTKPFTMETIVQKLREVLD